jgi:hypothetical protein
MKNNIKNSKLSKMKKDINPKNIYGNEFIQ